MSLSDDIKAVRAVCDKGGTLTIRDSIEHHDACRRILSACEEMEKALKFYADEKNYDDDCAPIVEAFHEGVHHDDWDMGQVARECLKKVRG
jgi:hypothetical protein